MMCDHRNERGVRLPTRLLHRRVVCARCEQHLMSTLRPFPARNYLTQINFAEAEVRVMAAMMMEIGFEFVDDEAVGTSEQFEEFQRRWEARRQERINDDDKK